MEFANPIWLNGLFAVPVLVVLLLWGAGRRRREALQFTGTPLGGALAPGRSWRKDLLKTLLKAGTLALLVLALARPQMGSQLVKVQREGIDLVIALDVSLSMLAEDMKPSRLERAKQEIVDLIRGLKGDRIGIVAFAGDAVVLCPLTVDYGAARMFAQSADIDLVSLPGSALHKAIDTSVQLFPESQKHDRVIILVTDGESHTGDPVAAAEKAASMGVRIYTIGIGRAQGELIPLRGTDGAMAGYKKDNAGETVLTRLDEGTLRRIAQVSHGKYLPATREGLELKVLYKEISGLETKIIEGEFMERKMDRFSWFLGGAFLLLGLDTVLTRRGSTKPRRGGRLLHTGVTGAFLLIALLPVTASAKKNVDRKRVESGNQYFESGEYRKALSLYREAVGDTLSPPKHAEGVLYNQANALHMMGKLEHALGRYNRSFVQDDSLQAGRVLYNRGNTLLKMGKLDDAIESYLQALQYMPDDAETRYNLELALKQRQQKQQQQKQQQKSDSDDQQDQQKQDDQQQNQQDQNQDQQEGQNQQEQQDQQDQQEQQPQQPDSTQMQQPDSTQIAPPDSVQVQSMKLSKEDALRILKLLEEQEKELQKQKRKAAFKRAIKGKDW